MYAAMLAEVYRKEQRIPEALEALESGLAVVRSTDAHLWEPELYRLRGEIGLLAGETETDAEAWLQRSLQVARGQQARSLELRAAVSLCRHAPAGARTREARERLASILKCFSEGFETADLLEAKRLVDAR